MRKQHGFAGKWARWCVLISVLLIGTCAFAVTSGSYLTYFTSTIDDSRQFYGIYIPTSYSKYLKHPVIFIGHGFKGSATNSFSSYQRSFANSYGFLLVQVHGRGNSFYDGVGEMDFFEVLADLKARYTIDENRLYFEGASMGATGAYRLGVRFPDIFAAVGGCDGFADYRVWYEQYYAPADNPTEVEPSQIPNLEMASVVDTAARANWQHIWMTVDTADTSVAPLNTYNLRDTLAQLAAFTPEVDYQYIYDTNVGGHTAGYDQASMYSYFRGITNNLYPKHVKLVTNRLKYGTQYWVRVDRLQTANAFADIDATATGNTINVKTSNVLAYSLASNANLVNTAQAVTVFTNGLLSYQGPANIITLYAQRTDGMITGWSTNDLEKNNLWKKAGLEGPIGDAFTSRFIVFYGASGSTAETAANRAEAQDFCDKWKLWMNATIVPHPDTDLSSLLNLTDWANTTYGNRHIILFGTIESSAVLSSLQDQLPLTVSADGVFVGSTPFVGSEYGAFFVYPNPRNPQKYLVVSHGQILIPALTQQTWISDPAAYAKDLEALPWYWPDYVVFRTDIIPRVSVQDKLAYLPDAFVAAGYFDTTWQLPVTRRPDALIGMTESTLTGDGVYGNTTNQTISQTVAAGTPVTYYVKIQNDGTEADTYKITGATDNTAITVQYFTGNTNVTNSIMNTAGSGLSVNLGAGASYLLRVVAVLSDAATLSTISTTVTSANDAQRSDTVAATFQKLIPLVITKFAVDKSSVTLGETVVLSAESTGGTNVQYQFQAGDAFSPWSTNKIISWTPNAAGVYTLTVYARSGDTGNPVSRVIPNFVVAAPLPPTITSFNVSPTSGATVGSSVQLSATTTGGVNVQYQFQAGSLVSGWSTTPTYIWKPSAAGTYTLTVFARSGDFGTPVSRSTTNYIVKTLPLTGVSLRASPTNARVGTAVTLTATPTGGQTVEYRFAYIFSGRTYTIRNWGTTNYCTWTPSRRGSYTLVVYAREVGSTRTVTKYLAYSILR